MSDEIKQSKRGGARPGAGRKRKAAEPQITKQTDTRWKPGQSGNPGGRPAVVKEVRDLARAKSAIAFQTLVAACEDAKAPWAARIAAAAHILDRGFGKPTQSIRAAIRDPKAMTDAELVAFLAGDDEAGSGEGAAEAEGDSQILN